MNKNLYILDSTKKLIKIINTINTISIKVYDDTYTSELLTFIYHVVNIKPSCGSVDIAVGSRFIYHVVNIKLTAPFAHSFTLLYLYIT